MRKYVSFFALALASVFVSSPAMAQLPTDHLLTRVKIDQFLSGLEMSQPSDLSSVKYHGESIRDLKVVFPELTSVNDFTPEVNPTIAGMYAGLMTYIGPIKYTIAGSPGQSVVRLFRMKVNFVCGEGEPSCLYRLRRAFEHGLEVVTPYVDPGDGKDVPDTITFLYLEPTSGTK